MISSMWHDEIGGQVVGPYLKEMARLAHTEYFIERHSTRDPREILRETMFAPTVTGSPLESACRVIKRYEPYGRDEQGDRTMDSSLVIRADDIDSGGRVGSVWAPRLYATPPRSPKPPKLRPRRLEYSLVNRRVLVVDAEDTFTSMIDHQLRSMGLSVTVRRFDMPYAFDDYDFVVMGPGPDDPRETENPKTAHLRSAISTLLAEQRPFLAVCPSHQVLSTQLGFDLVRRIVPNQGTQREIDLFGARERVGFYNTFAASSREDKQSVYSDWSCG